MASKHGKRYLAQKKKVDVNKNYEVAEACSFIVGTASAKFDESVELVLRLGVDPKKSEQNVRGSIALPHGLGKTIRVAVFARGDKAKEAQAAGADFVGAEDLVEKVNGGFLDFDSVIATPDMMGQVGKLGKVLGPRGLMPTPKVGTVTFELDRTIREIKGGRAEFRVEKAGIVQVGIGKASFGSDKIKENLLALVGAINKAKPSTSKGVYLKSGFLSLTMGPAVKLELSPLRVT